MPRRSENSQTEKGATETELTKPYTMAKFEKIKLFVNPNATEKQLDTFLELVQQASEKEKEEEFYRIFNND